MGQGLSAFGSENNLLLSDLERCHFLVTKPVEGTTQIGDSVSVAALCSLP